MTDSQKMDPSAHIETLTNLQQRWEQQQTRLLEIKQRLINNQKHAIAEINTLTTMQLKHPIDIQISMKLQHHQQELKKISGHFEETERQLSFCIMQLSQVNNILSQTQTFPMQMPGIMG